MFGRKQKQYSHRENVSTVWASNLDGEVKRIVDTRLSLQLQSLNHPDQSSKHHDKSPITGWGLNGRFICAYQHAHKSSDASGGEPFAVSLNRRLDERHLLKTA